MSTSGRTSKRQPEELAPEDVDHPSPASPTPDDLPSIFEELGLSSYESRVLAAVMGLNSGTASEIARVAGVQRSNVYPVLDSLQRDNLVAQRPGKVARWECPERDEVVRRLCTSRVERLQAAAAEVEAKGQDALRAIAKLGRPEGAPPLPFVHLLDSVLQTSAIYHRYLGEADEVLVCNREPYTGKIGVFEPIMSALARGIRARALYRAIELEERDDLREAAVVYARAGVESRVVDDLPSAVAVFDRRVVITALFDPAGADPLAPTILYVEHPAFAATYVDSFERLWESARPFLDAGAQWVAKSDSSTTGGRSRRASADRATEPA